MSQSNITFNVWLEEFRHNYEHIFTFIEDMDAINPINPLKAELKADLSVEEYDSYGSEDSVLKRVYYFAEYDLYIMFSGIRQSYSGEEWTEMKEVKPIIKHIEVYE